ncbi:hypothetical protein D9M71_239950 [compost metagenome]
MQVVRKLTEIVAKQVLKCFSGNAKGLCDEGVISVRPGGLFDWPFEIAFLLKIHELADAQRAVHQCPVDPVKAASIDSGDVGLSNNVVEQTQQRAVITYIAQPQLDHAAIDSRLQEAIDFVHQKYGCCSQ